MKQSTQFFLGIQSYKDAHVFISKHKLWGYIFVPGLLNIILVIGTIYLMKFLKISDYFDITQYDWGWFSWLLKTLGFIINIVGFAIVAVIYLFIYKNLLLILMSPILSLLIDKVDEINTGQKIPFSFSQIFKDLSRGLRITLRNMSFELLFIGLFFLLGFIPLIGFIFPILLLAIQWYFVGFGMLDFTNERRRLNYKERIKYCRNNKWLAVSNGMIFTLILLVPLIGILIAPTYAAVAANIGINKK